MNTEPQKPGGKPGEINERDHKCCLATAGAVTEVTSQFLLKFRLLELFGW